MGDDVGYDEWWKSSPQEVVDPLRLKVEGTLPEWLHGNLIRVGPGRFEVGRQKLQHQIDGLAKITKYKITRGGDVTFQTRHLQTDLFNRTGMAAPPSSLWALWTEPALVTMLPVQPTYTPCQRVRAIIEEPATDNTNIVVWRTGKTIHACSDTSVASNAFDLETLESRGHAVVEVDAPRRETDTITGAHRHHVINGSDTVGWSGRVDLSASTSVPATIVSVYRDTPVEADAGAPMAKRRYIGQVRIPLAEHGLPMIHSFQVTERYVIFVVCSLCVEPHLIGSKLFVLAEPFAGVQTLGWRGEQNTTVYVMDIESTDPTAKPVRTFTIDPMFMNHHINAWEDAASGQITMDVIAYKDGSFLSNPRGFGNLEVMRSHEERAALKGLHPTIRRYTLNMQRGAAHKSHHLAAGHRPAVSHFPAVMSATKTAASRRPATHHRLDANRRPAAHRRLTAERRLAAKQRAASRAAPHWAPWTPFELSFDRRWPTPADEWPAPPGLPAATGPLHMEMPCFNERKHGSPYRYVWGVGSPGSAPTHVTGLVKVDLGEPGATATNGREKVDAPCLSWYRTSHYPSEPIFVPRPGATAEDDGVLLSVMLDGKRSKSYLLVLNATTMQTMATAYSPVVMPADFHGAWFSDDEM